MLKSILALYSTIITVIAHLCLEVNTLCTDMFHELKEPGLGPTSPAKT